MVSTGGHLKPLRNGAAGIVPCIVPCSDLCYHSSIDLRNVRVVVGEENAQRASRPNIVARSDLHHPSDLVFQARIKEMVVELHQGLYILCRELIKGIQDTKALLGINT
jgi:hypothetical protein